MMEMPCTNDGTPTEIGSTGSGRIVSMTCVIGNGKEASLRSNDEILSYPFCRVRNDFLFFARILKTGRADRKCFYESILRIKATHAISRGHRRGAMPQGALIPKRTTQQAPVRAPSFLTD